MERWQQVEEIFHEALRRDPAERDAFLRQACRDDSGLRREVASLLAHHRADSSSESWAAAAAGQLVNSSTSLQPGQSLGPYQIESFVAAGGMGEVYRAHDPRMGRDVAVKITTERFSDRFSREVRAVAALNHPNICQLYDVGPNYLVMELVEGLTLAERLKQGSVPLEEVLAIAKQIAEAIEAAHEKGIVHRDLKPGNIKLRPDGAVKVLDFGLARVTESSDAGPQPEDSPTLTLEAATRVGTILGTAAYMSPEQARGKAADKRSDIWSFGAVLYEMLSGQRAFGGESTSDILAAVLKLEPDWNALPKRTRAPIRRLIQRCLTKDRRQRLQAIGEARIVIEECLSGALPEIAEPQPAKRIIAPWAAAAVLAISTLVGLGGWWRATRPVDHPLMRFSAELTHGPNGTLRLDDTTLTHRQPGTNLALSPDGVRLAVQVRDTDGKIRLAVRRLDEARFTPLTGTEKPTSQFFSPDGRWIAFFGDGKLRKIPVQGGAPVVLCSAQNFPSGSWGDDDNIVAALSTLGVLSKVPSAGGTPVPITELRTGEIMHRWPQVLPGSDVVLFTAYRGGGPEDSSIEILSLKTHERKTLIRGGVEARYVADSEGHRYLVYLHQNTLLAVAFDPSKRAIMGAAQPVLDDVTVLASNTSPGDFDVSRTGTFVYVSGRGEAERSIFWLDSTGKTELLLAGQGFYNGLSFSPDGRRLAFGMGDLLRHEDLWVQDLERNTPVRLTFLAGTSTSPVWVGDGKYMIFQVGNQPNPGIYWIRSDGVGEPKQLASSVGPAEKGSSEFPSIPTSISLSRRLALVSGNPFTAVEVSTAPLGGFPDHAQLGKPELFLSARGFPMPAFSPDGRWLAYASEETDSREVYVQPFPGPGAKVRVSLDGGSFPTWSPNGRELFFLGPDRRIMVAGYTAKGDSFLPGKPSVWSQQQILLNYGGGPFQTYALSPDGKRFAVILYPDGTTEPQNLLHLTFLLNFADELRRRVLNK